MQKRVGSTKAVLVVTVLALIATWIYYPSYYPRGGGQGWHFLFDTSRYSNPRVDFGRLFLLDVIIVAIGGLLAWRIRATGRLFFTRAIARRVLFVLSIVVIAAFFTLITLYSERMAAELGDTHAQFNLGVDYHDGNHGLPQDFAEAARWYRKAAEQGEPYAQKNLGTSLANGQGVPKDLQEAYVWLSLAAAHGHSDAHAKQDFVASQLDRESIANAQRRAAEFVPKKQGKDSNLLESPTPMASPSAVWTGTFDPDGYFAGSPATAGAIFDKIAAASKVALDDLNKIVLFDVGVEEEPSFSFRRPNPEHSVREFHGRVRNELSRAVEAVEIKASIYNTPGKLIETRTFRLYQRPFEPGAPASFSAFQLIRHLPEHYYYRLEVVGAQYSR